MAAVFMTLEGWKLVFADDDAGLAASGTHQDASCQITSAALEPVENTADTPATMCAPAGSTVLKSGDDLVLTAAQDWSDPKGLSWYLRDNDGKTKHFQLTMGANGGSFAGQVGIRAGAVGGAADATLEASVSLPVVPGTLTGTKPTAPTVPTT